MALLLSRHHVATVMYPPPLNKNDTVRNTHEVIGVKFSKGIEEEASLWPTIQLLQSAVQREFKDCVFEVTKKGDGRMIMRLIIPSNAGVSDFSGLANRLVRHLRNAILLQVSVGQTERDVIERTLNYVAE